MLQRKEMLAPPVPFQGLGDCRLIVYAAPSSADRGGVEEEDLRHLTLEELAGGLAVAARPTESGWLES